MLENLKEMDEFLDSFKLPKLNQRDQQVRQTHNKREDLNSNNHSRTLLYFQRTTPNTS